MRNIFFAFILFPVFCLGQQHQGPLTPGSAGNTSCPFSYSSMVDYLPAESIFISDDDYAKASHCDCCDANTRCLETSGYGFAIPATATINGILVEVEKKASGGAMIQDNGVKLIKEGITVGNSMANPSNWPFADTYFSYGGETELWGVDWLPQEINGEGFGVALASISYTCFGTGAPAISYLDNIRITVYYTDIATNVVSVAEPATFYITPNPVSGNFVELNLPSSAEQVTITVVDLEGRIHDKMKLQAVEGKIKMPFSLPPGNYLLQIKEKGSTSVQKLMVD
ncbi:MAG: T9SS type A sorting domain-containing protein [Chitinophagales bacterium]